MPVFHYICTSCNKTTRRLCTPDRANTPPPCVCSGTLVRTPSAPTTHLKEKLDNGLMPKAVERFVDAERMYKERSGK